jgi:hypothetical protein
MKKDFNIGLGINTAEKYSNRFITAIISLMLFFTGCISPYEPDFKGESGLLVVDASLIKGVEKQVIVISKTAPITIPEFQPVENCNVKIIDNLGNEFVFIEESPGKYVANIDDAWLTYDSQYKLVFTTSSGEAYESDFQQILETAPVDSVYGITERRYSPKTNEESITGIQFYVDLDAPQDASKYYRLVLTETWENYVKDEIWGVYDGTTIKRFFPGDSLQHCWKTKDVTGLYSVSTVNLSMNSIKKVPLHFLDKESDKLFYKYCATIKLYALNADAYDYWYEKERELNESGDIYTIQPNQPKSNIHNTNNPDELVMGFFWVSSQAIKRVFIKNPNPSEMRTPGCYNIVAYSESEDFNDVTERLNEAIASHLDMLQNPPYYITVQYRTNYRISITPYCVDCRILGGDAKRPDFWE